MKNYILIAVGVVMVFGAVFFASTANAAWTNPTLVAPGGNTEPPLDTSNTAQTKGGGLVLNNAGAAVGLLVPYGNIGFGTNSPSSKLHVVGNVIAQGFYYSSDRKMKEDIKTLSDSLSNILKLRGVSFIWKETKVPSVGLVAQEVEKVYPAVVHTDPHTGLKSVEYANLVGPLIEAIREQQSQIDELRAEVASLRANR